MYEEKRNEMGVEEKESEAKSGSDVRGEGEKTKLLHLRCNWHEMLLAKINV